MTRQQPGPSGPARRSSQGPSGPAKRGGPGPRGLAPSLDRLTRALGAPESHALAALFERWHEIAGPEIAAHAQPISLVNGVLAVGVDQPAWVTHLTYTEADLRGRLDEVLGPGRVQRIELRVRPH